MLLLNYLAHTAERKIKSSRQWRDALRVLEQTSISLRIKLPVGDGRK
jgi:hypothetical protein